MTKKIFSMLIILNYILYLISGFFLLFGTLGVLFGDFIFGISFLLIGLILLPKFSEYVKDKYSYEIPIYIKSIYIILIIIIFGIFVGDNNIEEKTENSNIEEKTEDEYYKVTRVVDGDTIVVLKNGDEKKVRLIGIDTPETVDSSKQDECFGLESSKKATELLKGKKVRLEADETQDNKDFYGRLLRYIFLEDNFFYNAYMIENGYALEYTYKTAYKYQDKFKDLEEKAKKNKVGFWFQENCDGNLEIRKELEEEQKANLGYKFYTSSHHSAKLYYCKNDTQWQGLSEKYLKKFYTEEELLEAFPDRTLSEPCK